MTIWHKSCSPPALWATRGLVSLVFLSNLSAAVPYVLWPARYQQGFEVDGIAGTVLVRSIGLLFLMWVVPYVPAILQPVRFRACVGVIIVQQLIGLGGEVWMWLTLPAGHPALYATGTRFIIFDSVGLGLLLGAWWLVHRAERD